MILSDTFLVCQFWRRGLVCAWLMIMLVTEYCFPKKTNKQKTTKNRTGCNPSHVSNKIGIFIWMQKWLHFLNLLLLKPLYVNKTCTKAYLWALDSRHITQMSLLSVLQKSLSSSRCFSHRPSSLGWGTAALVCLGLKYSRSSSLSTKFRTK